MTDLRQSENFASYMEKIGWEVDRLQVTGNGLQVYIKKIPAIGNFVKIWRPDAQIPPKVLDRIARQHHAFAVQINYSPTKTLILDLNLPLDEILDRMTKKTRYEIRKAQADKIEVKKSKDIELFAGMWEQNAFHRGFWLPLKKEIKSVYEAFGENAYLLLGYLGHLDKKPLAGALILISGKTASYFHAASSPQGRHLAVPSLLVWEAIKLAKTKKCKVFDFEGIYDERFPINSWRGFTHFKKSFGGREIEYPGSFIKFYHPVLRWLDNIHTWQRRLNSHLWQRSVL